jgi:hypothetical protein
MRGSIRLAPAKAWDALAVRNPLNDVLRVVRGTCQLADRAVFSGVGLSACVVFYVGA